MSEIKDYLNQQDALYYDNDQPELTDEEYDALVARSDTESSLGSVSNNFERVKHISRVKSLNKTNKDNVKSFIEKFRDIVIELKYDGLTLVLEEGKAVTRGNGIEGEDITAAVSYIIDPSTIEFTKDKTYGIRGEIVITARSFDIINSLRIQKGFDKFKNPRNAAAGLVRTKDLDPEMLDLVSFIPHGIVGLDISYEDANQIYKEAGLYYNPPLYEGSSHDRAMEVILEFNRDSVQYDIDGLVIKCIRENSLAEFGETEHHPNNAVAYKFENVGKWTTLYKITWQVGRTGKITPVAHFTPIDLDGSTVSKSTLHNMGYINGLGLHLGDRVYVIKSKEIIPAIIDCWPGIGRCEISTPTICPDCGLELEEDGANLFCRSTDCKSKIVARLSFMLSRDALDMKGISDETIVKLLDNNIISCVNDFFKLNEDHLESIKSIPGMGEINSKYLLNTIKSRINTVPLDKYIYAAGMPLIGKKVSKEIAGLYGNMLNVYMAGPHFDKLMALEGIGPSIIESLNTNIGMIRDLDGVGFTSVEPLVPRPEQKSICITGTLSQDRFSFERRITLAGHRWTNSVTKKTDFLVMGREPGSTKVDKAIKYGIPIIDEEELEAMLNA